MLRKLFSFFLLVDPFVVWSLDPWASECPTGPSTTLQQHGVVEDFRFADRVLLKGCPLILSVVCSVSVVEGEGICCPLWAVQSLLLLSLSLRLYFALLALSALVALLASCSCTRLLAGLVFR